jgi:molybdopterin/thiamine biosynthesis adenylyltransferase
LFPEAEDVEALSCSTTGVFAPLVGIIGSMQAAEAIKVIAGVGKTLKGRLLMLDALDMHWHSVRVKRDPRCLVCANRS